MTFSTFLESTECIRLGWALLHSLWQLAVIAALCGFTLMLTQSTARLRYVIAYISLLLMAAAPVATFALLPPPNAPDREAKLPLGEGHEELAASEASGERVAAVSIPALGDNVDDGSIAFSEMSPDLSTIPVATEAEFGAIAPAADGTSLVQTISSWSAWIVPFWLLGVAALAVRHLGGWLLVRRMLATAAPLDNAPLQAKLVRLAQAMGLSVPVRILRTAMAEVPLVVGWLRPTLLVPVSLMTGLTPDQWDAVLAHELAHIRRRDYAMNLLQIAIETLLFYHPAVWWLSRRVRAEREHCCDNIATDIAGNRIALAEALTVIESQRAGAGALAAVAASGPLRDGSTLHRVRRILNLAEPAERRSNAWIIGGVVLLAIVTWCVLGASQSEKTAVAETEAGGSQASEDPELPESSPPVRGVDAETELRIEELALVGRDAEQREPKSWEITKRYGEGWLHKQFLLHEGLPEKITVPAIEATVIDADGRAVAGAEVVSHTPRHWVRIMPDMTLHPQPHGSATKTNSQGKFKLPKRTEPYRVLVLHDSGIANVTHETLLYAKGRITLQRWARIEGAAIFGSEPLANTRILVRPDYSVWSYSTGGPRVTGDINVETDDLGRFTIDKAPPIDGRAFLMRPLTELDRQKSSAPLSHATHYVCKPGKRTRLPMGRGKVVAASLSPVDLGPEQWIDWTNAVVWLRHSDSAKPRPVELPAEIAELDETAENEWRWNWQLTTPEGRAHSARRSFLTNQNFYGAVANSGEFQIDGVPEGTYDLAVRGFRVLGEKQPRSVYFSKKPITVEAPLDKPLKLGGWDMVDAETWRKSLAEPSSEQETQPSKVAIHRVVGHKSALPFGRGGNGVKPRRIRFGAMSPDDTRFDAMRPERYPLDGLEYNPTPLISIDDITVYDWRKHELHLTGGALDRLRRSIKPTVWGVPFVVVVDGRPTYLGAFWTGASSYSANMPTICLDPWVWTVPEGEDRYLPKNAVRIENSQVLKEGEDPSDPRANADLRKSLDECGKLIDTRSVVEKED